MGYLNVKVKAYSTCWAGQIYVNNHFKLCPDIKTQFIKNIIKDEIPFFCRNMHGTEPDKMCRNSYPMKTHWFLKKPGMPYHTPINPTLAGIPRMEDLLQRAILMEISSQKRSKKRRKGPGTMQVTQQMAQIL